MASVYSLQSQGQLINHGKNFTFPSPSIYLIHEVGRAFHYGSGKPGWLLFFTNPIAKPS